jgi:hypothetical protein
MHFCWIESKSCMVRFLCSLGMTLWGDRKSRPPAAARWHFHWRVIPSLQTLVSSQKEEMGSDVLWCPQNLRTSYVNSTFSAPRNFLTYLTVEDSGWTWYSRDLSGVCHVTRPVALRVFNVSKQSYFFLLWYLHLGSVGFKKEIFHKGMNSS